jgi:hypothetical protein
MRDSRCLVRKGTFLNPTISATELFMRVAAACSTAFVSLLKVRCGSTTLDPTGASQWRMSGLPQKQTKVPLVNIVPLIRSNSFAVKSGVADLSCILCFPPRCPSLAWFRCGVHPRGNVFTAFTRHRARSPVGDVQLFSELTGWRPPARLPPASLFSPGRTQNPLGRRQAITRVNVRFYSRSHLHLFSLLSVALCH